MTPMVTTPKGSLTRRQRARRVVRRVWQKMSLPVFFVLFLFGFLYYTTSTIVLYGRFETSVDGTIHRSILFVTTSLALCLYVASVMCEAGKVPDGWQPDMEDANNFWEVKRKGKGLKRFCQKCNAYKPPRAHHCRVCQKCVLRMDHHCVWINNCVGHKNYKAFFLFLFYAVLAVGHSAMILSWNMVASESGSSKKKLAASNTAAAAAAAAATTGSNSDSNAWDWDAICEVTALMVSFPLLLAIGLLFAWHVWLTSKNCTTIEHYEGVRSKLTLPHPIGENGERTTTTTISSEGGDGSNKATGTNATTTIKKIEHPYSLGLSGNLREVLGAKMRYWLFPGCSIDGDGLSFANAYENSDKWKRKVNQELEL
jgi:palmitoyltransferase